ncbi:hypothetical protein F0562_015839 [Nyssa sinensis]|uniref:RING-type domain-containing protein n=1 Tax=Nyssa sinensis TaxID=561372 RepID=A0A5J4ZKZ8_9ASTE|nr:hypothetical protein F0562_015839 [Nyssa sinensis]
MCGPSYITVDHDDTGHEAKVRQEAGESASISPKCPFGYDSQTFKLGPFSCMICQALLFESSKCVPCSHVYCKACISRFKDCPLCGADIEKIEADTNLQNVVDQERCFLCTTGRAFRAHNIESAKSRLSLCAEDIRGQLERMGNTPELCSQLGAVLGMLGDCCRAMADSGSAVSYFEESVNFLLKVPRDDSEITHTLSVSLNKIGDLKYYDGDLQAVRSYYFQSLNVRCDAIKHHPSASSQILDVATSLAKVADVDRNLENEDTAIEGFQEAIKLLESLKLNSEEAVLQQRILDVATFLAKVADVDRNLGNEDTAIEGFQEAIKLLESLKLNSKEPVLQQRRLSVLEFLNNQVAQKQPHSTP